MRFEIQFFSRLEERAAADYSQNAALSRPDHMSFLLNVPTTAELQRRAAQGRAAQPAPVLAPALNTQASDSAARCAPLSKALRTRPTRYQGSVAAWQQHAALAETGRAPPEVTGSIEQLSDWLVAPFSSEEEKHRALFRWVAANIVYDPEVSSRPPFSSLCYDSI